MVMVDYTFCLLIGHASCLHYTMHIAHACYNVGMGRGLWVLSAICDALPWCPGVLWYGSPHGVRAWGRLLHGWKIPTFWVNCLRGAIVEKKYIFWTVCISVTSSCSQSDLMMGENDDLYKRSKKRNGKLWKLILCVQPRRHSYLWFFNTW